MKRTFLIIAAMMLLSISSMWAEDQTPSFPGAEGYGMYVTGGRGGAVYHVTNLNDSGEGSFRYAIQQSGARTIVFDVSGTIFLESQLDITNGNVTIAGQTAPGQGICIADWPVVIKSSNVIIRYMRFRLGNNHVSVVDGDGGHEGDGLCCFGSSNIMIDHCSVSWSIDECLAIYGNRNTTVQWCISSQSLRNAGHSKGNHGYGGMMGGGKTTYHHNLLAHHDSRTPRFCFRSGDEPYEDTPTDYRNNVNYNWGGNGCYGAEDMCINIVNNYYKIGGATKLLSTAKKKRIVAPGVGTRTDANGDTIYVWGKYYLDGNVNPTYTDVTNDNWTYGLLNQVTSSSQHGTWTATTKDTIRKDTVMPFALVTTHDATMAYNKVLAYAGCSLWRDGVDSLIISDVTYGEATYTGDGNSPGIINSQEDIRPADAGTEWDPWPTLVSYDAWVDTDGDGIPDDWEEANGLDPNDATDGNVTNDEGYTNLELWMNSLVADITEAQAADGELLGEDIASTGALREVTNDTEATEYEISAATHTSDWDFTNGFSITNDGDASFAKSSEGNYIKCSYYVTYTIHIPDGITIDSVRVCGKDWYDNRSTYLAMLHDVEYSSTDYPFSYEGVEYTIDIEDESDEITFMTAPKLCGIKFYLISTNATSSGIREVTTSTLESGRSDVYTLSGILVARGATQAEIDALPKGTYIIDHRVIAK